MKEKGKTSGIKDEDIVKLHVAQNPKKAGSKSAEDFAKYKNDMTVAEFKAAVGKDAAGHLAWDIKKGYISVHAPGSLPAAKKELTKESYIGFGKQSDVKGSDVIKLHPTDEVGKMVNPKKAGSKSEGEFAKYRDEMTVDEYVAAVGDKKKALANIKWDTDKGFVSVHSPESLESLRAGKTTAPKSHLPEGIDDSTQLLNVSTGEVKTVAEMKKPLVGSGFKNETVEKSIAASVKEGSLKKYTAPKVADLKSSDHLVLQTTGPNPYKEGSPEWIKYKAFELQHGKPHTLDSYMATKSLDTTQKKAVLQTLIDDGHIKLVTKEQLAAVAAAKAASPYPVVKQSAKPKLPDVSDERWGKVLRSDTLEDLRHKDSGYDLMMQSAKNMGAVRRTTSSSSALASYKGSGYSYINSSLREGKPPTSQALALDALMKPTTADAIVYRGHNVKYMNNMPPPPEFEELGFSSVSHNPAVSQSFSKGSNTIFRIRVPKGTPALQITQGGTSDEALRNELGYEAEVVLARGTRYKYVSHETVGGWKIIDVIAVGPHGGAAKSGV